MEKKIRQRCDIPEADRWGILLSKIVWLRLQFLEKLI